MTDALFDLEGQAILLAGGAGGLGAPLAEAFAARGAHVVIADINVDRAEETAEKLRRGGGTAHATVLDVVDPESCAAAVTETIAACERIDGVVNATGVYKVGKATELPDADWKLTIDVNLTGAFMLARAAGRAMIEQGSGRIVTIASVSSRVANPLYAAYAASKAGVSHLTRVLAVEWAHHGVTVNAIGPAVTPTPLAQPILDDESVRAAALERIPTGRFGTPEDIVGAAVFLLSPAGAFVTGQTIYVDGGRTIS